MSGVCRRGGVGECMESGEVSGVWGGERSEWTLGEGAESWGRQWSLGGEGVESWGGSGVLGRGVESGSK